MSDALLERVAKSLEGILAHIQKSPVFGLPVTGGAATAPKTSPGATAGATGGDAAAKKAAADKAAAEKAAKDKAAKDAAAKAAAAKAAAGPASGTKAPGGKHTIDEVREAIRTVATTPSLGKQSATDILADDGGGVTKVTDLKPEFYDAVFDACQALLNNEGGEDAAGSSADDLL